MRLRAVHGSSTQMRVRQNVRPNRQRFETLHRRATSIAGNGASRAGLANAHSPQTAPDTAHCRTEVDRSRTRRPSENKKADREVSHNRSGISTTSGDNAHAHPAISPTLSLK